MKAVLQRVKHASVHIDFKEHSAIEKGLLILLGVEEADTSEDVKWLSSKIANLRIFADEEGQSNRSIVEISGQALVVSQFTLHAKTKKGNRPSYIKAARPQTAIPLYDAFLKQLEIDSQNTVKAGVFGADMQVSLCNDGPITIIIDTKDKS